MGWTGQHNRDLAEREAYRSWLGTQPWWVRWRGPALAAALAIGAAAVVTLAVVAAS